MTEGLNETKVRELEIALDNRAFELQLFWQRSNYFIVLMTALGVGVFAIKDALFSFLIAAFATIVSWFWYRTNLGSKFWHESWEVEVSDLSQELKIRSFMKPTSEIIRQVSRSLRSSRGTKKRRGLKERFFLRVRIFIDGETIKKPSVSYNMILLSIFSILLWGSVTVAFGYRLLTPHEALPGTKSVQQDRSSPQVTSTDQPNPSISSPSPTDALQSSPSPTPSPSPSPNESPRAVVVPRVQVSK